MISPGQSSRIPKTVIPKAKGLYKSEAELGIKESDETQDLEEPSLKS